MGLFSPEMEQLVSNLEDIKEKGSVFQKLKELTVGTENNVMVSTARGSWWGNAVQSAAPARINMDGSVSFNSITINGIDVSNTFTTGGAIITDIINERLNTSTKKILSDFTFGSTDYAGSFKTGNITWNASTGAITGGTGSVYNKKGLIFANNGTATITLDGETGSATFGGSLAAPSGTLGIITAGTIRATGNVCIGDINGHYGLSLNGYSGDAFGGDYNNIFFKRSDGIVFFRINSGGSSSITYDSSSGVLEVKGKLIMGSGSTLDASYITAGVITGRTLRTAAPGAGVGSSVSIIGGNNEMVHFYYNGTETATIKGYTTEGSEVTYLRIDAASGRNLRFKNSHIACDGNFLPTSNDAYDLGTSGTMWRAIYCDDAYVDNGFTGDIYVATSDEGKATKKLNIEQGIVYDR